MFRSLTVKLSQDLKKNKKFAEHIEAIAKRPFTNIHEEWGLAVANPGRPERVHSDAKSTVDAQWTFWLTYGVGPKGEGTKRLLTIMQGGTYNKNKVLMQADVGNVENINKIDGKDFKIALREALKECSVEVDALNDIA